MIQKITTNLDNLYQNMIIDPFDRYIVAVKMNIIYIFSIYGDMKLKILKEHRSIITSLNFTPDGKHLITASDDKMIKVWNLREMVD